MTAWGRSLGTVLVVAFVVTATDASALASDAQSTPRIQVGASSSLTAVSLVGETLRDDPDVSANRPDDDGLTHVSSATWLTVESTATAPYAGTFAVCTYPWYTNDFGDESHCDDAASYGVGQQWRSAATVYLDPAYSGGRYKFYVYLWEWTGTDFEAVDWVWFTVAVDRAPGGTTPVDDGGEPTTADQPPAMTPEGGGDDSVSDTGGDGGGGSDGGDGTGDGDGADSDAGNGGEGADVVEAGPDRGDLFSPRNVALMMLFLAAASLLVQLLRGP